ncbi:hypothetical protein D3C83_46320 [compost metagenome]
MVLESLERSISSPFMSISQPDNTRVDHIATNASRMRRSLHVADQRRAAGKSGAGGSTATLAVPLVHAEEAGGRLGTLTIRSG